MSGVAEFVLGNQFRVETGGILTVQGYDHARDMWSFTWKNATPVATGYVTGSVLPRWMERQGMELLSLPDVEDVRVGDRLVDTNGQVGVVKEIRADHWLMDDGFCLGFVALQRGARMLPRLPEPYEAPRAEPVANLKDKVAEVEVDRDAKELAWWRTQFSTRFPDGKLPKPGTPLAGKRYHLSEGVPYRGVSFHVGVDLADGPSKTIISVVKDGEVVAYAQLDVAEEVQKIDAHLTNFYPNATRVLDRELRRLVRSLRTGRVPSIEPAEKPPAWTPDWDPFNFLKP